MPCIPIDAQHTTKIENTNLTTYKDRNNEHDKTLIQKHAGICRLIDRYERDNIMAPRIVIEDMDRLKIIHITDSLVC